MRALLEVRRRGSGATRVVVPLDKRGDSRLAILLDKRDCRVEIEDRKKPACMHVYPCLRVGMFIHAALTSTPNSACVHVSHLLDSAH